MLVLLVPRELQVEHSGSVKEMTDQQIDDAIAAIKQMIAPHRANRSKPPKSLGSTLERARLAELILWDWRVMGIGSCSH